MDKFEFDRQYTHKRIAIAILAVLLIEFGIIICYILTLILPSFTRLCPAIPVIMIGGVMVYCFILDSKAHREYEEACKKYDEEYESTRRRMMEEFENRNPYLDEIEIITRCGIPISKKDFKKLQKKANKFVRNKNNEENK